MPCVESLVCLCPGRLCCGAAVGISTDSVSVALCWCQLGGQEAGETPEQGCGALGTAGLVTVSQGGLLFWFLSCLCSLSLTRHISSWQTHEACQTVRLFHLHLAKGVQVALDLVAG